MDRQRVNVITDTSDDVATNVPRATREILCSQEIIANKVKLDKLE